MKNLIMAIALVSSSAVYAESSIIFNKLLIKKSHLGTDSVALTVNRDLKTWCAGLGSQISIGSFEVAEKLNSLAEGFYSCEGKYVQLTTDRMNPIQSFEIGACSEISAVELKADCPPRK